MTRDDDRSGGSILLVPQILATILLALLSEGVVHGAPSAHAASRPAVSRSGQDNAAVAISRLRSAQGLGAVTSDPVLQRAARQQAEAMAQAGTMSHDVAGSFSARLAKAGVKATRAAENIAAGQASLGQVLADWMASSGHRANLLLPDATRVGLAKVEGRGGPYWALVLAGPEPVQRRDDKGPWFGPSLRL